MRRGTCEQLARTEELLIGLGSTPTRGPDPWSPHTPSVALQLFKLQLPLTPHNLELILVSFRLLCPSDLINRLPLAMAAEQPALRLTIISWNVGGATPFTVKHSQEYLRKFTEFILAAANVDGRGWSDVVHVGLQEVLTLNPGSAENPTFKFKLIKENEWNGLDQGGDHRKSTSVCFANSVLNLKCSTLI